MMIFLCLFQSLMLCIVCKMDQIFCCFVFLFVWVFLAMPRSLRDLSSLTGIEPGFPQWKRWVKTTGPLGKSLVYDFMKYLFSALELLNLGYFREREALFIYLYLCHTHWVLNFVLLPKWRLSNLSSSTFIGLNFFSNWYVPSCLVTEMLPVY